MYHVSTHSEWEAAQNSYNLCSVSTLISWEVAQTSHDLYHVSVESSRKVALSSYDLCHVSARKTWEVAQTDTICVTSQLKAATQSIRAVKIFVMLQLRVAGK